MTPSLRPSFYAPVPDRDRADDLFQSYLSFLADRNGSLTGANRFERRDAMMRGFDGATPSYSGLVDNDGFNRAYEGRAERGAPADLLALLTFVKMNAGEAYGVQVTGEARAHLMNRPEPIFQVEKVLHHEEGYHTRMLVGASRHFEGVEVQGSWRPKWPLKLLLFCLARSPSTTFHPILLGSEISGVFLFNWMLRRVGTLFPNDPQIRASMEQRLVEVLIDEVGHIAYNRIAVSAAGLQPAKRIAAAVLASNDHTLTEAVALGLDAQARQAIDSFDYADLPEEVRRRSWFV
jgi:hypothetical protein